MTDIELENILIQLWGDKVKPFNVPETSRLIENINFTTLTTENLITLLDILVKASSSNRSGFSVDFDNYDILNFVRQKLINTNHRSVRLNPIRRCYDILFSNNSSTQGLFALSSMYLVAELEHILKKESKYLNTDGTIVKEIPRSLRNNLSTHNFRIGKRINQIGDIIKIYCYRNNSQFAEYIKSYDKKTKAFMKVRLKDAYNTVNGKNIKVRYIHTELITRINTSRNHIMHGEDSYLIGEIFFFLTLHSIYYLLNENMYDEY
jgi:hypothetical protein